MLIPYLLVLVAVNTIACKKGNPENTIREGRMPVIQPDYFNSTIPPNIAPLNFKIREKGSYFRIIISPSTGNPLVIKSDDGNVRIPSGRWKELLQASRGKRILIDVFAGEGSGTERKFAVSAINVASEPVDPYLCYRLLYPGYRSWSEMQIVQRSLEDFSEISVIDNRILDNNCINCHSFNKNGPYEFLVHVRGTKGGTYFLNGATLRRTDLKTKEMKANAVYPAWHPSGHFIAFSSNKTVQSFHMRPEKNIEVYDLFSSIVIYDLRDNEMFSCSDSVSAGFMETYPCWSPDGNRLFFCRAGKAADEKGFITARYDLMSRTFDAGHRSFGKTEMVFNASAEGKSVSFPEVSPDGKYLIFTLHDYGTFSIWHKEADLWLLELATGKASRMGLNSDSAESWHCWSTNGKWIVFSSKRLDGLTARPFISYFAAPDSCGKPFVLPQYDPCFYDRFPKTFNRPEFISARLKIGPRDFYKASGQQPVRPAWVNNQDKGSR
jgi:hypothetical protein